MTLQQPHYYQCNNTSRTRLGEMLTARGHGDSEVSEHESGKLRRRGVICEQRLKPAAPRALCAPSQGSRPEELPSQRRAQPRLLRIISSCKRRASLQEHSPAPRGTPPSLQGDLTQKKKKKRCEVTAAPPAAHSTGQVGDAAGLGVQTSPKQHLHTTPCCPQGWCGVKGMAAATSRHHPSIPQIPPTLTPREAPGERLQAAGADPAPQGQGPWCCPAWRCRAAHFRANKRPQKVPSSALLSSQR